MNRLCLWNVVEAVHDVSECDAEALSALVHLLLGEEIPDA
jgi:hypothetical protein